MDIKEEPEELEVTVDVVPQTVAEIIYLRNDRDGTNDNSVSSSEEESEGMYQIGSVDPSSIENCSLMLDHATQSVVLISSGFVNEDTLFLKPAEEECEENSMDSDLNNLSGLGEYICSLCNFKCRSLSSLQSHRLIHKSNFTKCQYNCNVCGKQFDKAQTLSHHFRVTHEFPKVTCNICGCVCVHEMALISHYKKHEPKQFSCDKCEAEYNNAKDLENHKKTHITNLLYACNKCGEGFSSTTEVSLHLRHVHAKPKNQFTNMRDTNGGAFSLVNHDDDFDSDSTNVETKKRKK